MSKIIINPISQYKILGIIGGEHSCGLTYIENGEIKYCLEEERFTRVKVQSDFERTFFRYPVQSLEYLKNVTGINLEEIDYFVSFLSYEHIRMMLSSIADFNLPEERFKRYEHHHSHCATAYYLSGFKKDTFVISVDASGDEHSSKYYLGSNSNLTYIDGIDINRHSLGHFYASITELLGFKRLKDEGKVVGLAGHGSVNHKLYEEWSKILEINDLKTNVSVNGFSEIYQKVNRVFFDVVGDKYWRGPKSTKDIAATGQKVFDDTILKIINQLHERYPDIKNICLAGGCFSNVKTNMLINNLEWVDEVFVAPPMGDEGLTLGSSLLLMKDLHQEIETFKVKNVYLGAEYSESQIDDAAKLILGENYHTHYFDEKLVSKLLIDGKILGLYQGKSEYGPRALGNRSIICEATNPDTYSELNNKLQRNDFMPFAPAVLDEDADILFDINKSKHTAQFMTMCYNTRPEWQEKLPTVVHPIDKTARVQYVTKENNFLFYKILKEYKKEKGFGCLVNTSFNIHNEPIVNKPEEAFVHLKNNIIDYLITPSKIYSIIK